MKRSQPLVLSGLTIGRNGRSVVANLSATFLPGKVHLLLGRSGSGKTTLFATMAGFLEPLAGMMEREGEPWKPSGNVGLAFQSPETMFFCTTVGEEVTFALRERGDSLEVAEKGGKDWLGSWGIDAESFWPKNPFHLSGGEKRRIALAASTIFQPDVILLDEPLAGLDPKGANLLRQRIAELAREHIVLVVTHDPEELLAVCGQIILLEHGEAIVFPGPEVFLREALSVPERYPLSDWYRQSIEPAGSTGRLPLPVVEEVAAFLADRASRIKPGTESGKVQEKSGEKLDT